jgi:putative transcription factor
MANCDLCGKETSLSRVDVEGTELMVCGGCSSFGKVLDTPRQAGQFKRKKVQLPTELEQTEGIITGFAQLIKSGRERLGLKQEDFARKINEKASVLHKVETGSIEPPINLARKLERALNIRLITAIEVDVHKKERKASGGMTVGDLITFK